MKRFILYCRLSTWPGDETDDFGDFVVANCRTENEALYAAGNFMQHNPRVVEVQVREDSDDGTELDLCGVDVPRIRSLAYHNSERRDGDPF